MTGTGLNQERQRVEALLERSFEETLSDSDRSWLEAHLPEFPDLQDCAQAVNGSGELWTEIDALPPCECPEDLPCRKTVLQHLAGLPVSALRLGMTYRLVLMAFGIGFVVAALAATGFRPDMALQQWPLVVFPAAVLLIGFVLSLSVFDTDSRSMKVASLSLLVVAPCVYIGFSIFGNPDPHISVPDGMSFIAAAFSCGTMGLVIGLAALVPAVLLAKRKMAGPSWLGAISLGVMSGGLGVGMLHLHCPVGDIDHMVVGHGMLFVIIPTIAIALRSAKRIR